MLAVDDDLKADGVPNRSSLVLGNNGDDEDVNGGAGIPVNSCTMALKFVVSVVNTVVGALLEALDLFFALRTTPVVLLLFIFVVLVELLLLVIWGVG